MKKSPTVRGGRPVTVTLRATREQVERIDKVAHERGLTRAAFVQLCANAGFQAVLNRKAGA